MRQYVATGVCPPQSSRHIRHGTNMKRTGYLRILLTILLLFSVCLFLLARRGVLVLPSRIYLSANVQGVDDVTEHRGVSSVTVVSWSPTNHSNLLPPLALCSREERLVAVEAGCRRNGGIRWDQAREEPLRSFPNLLVDDKHGIMYCGFAKAASTSWLTYLVKASGLWKPGQPITAHSQQIERYGLRRLRTYTDEEATHRLRTYWKFMVVRHPLDRLVSAWRDKLVMLNSPVRKTTGKKIITKYRGTYRDGDTAYFDEFLKYVADGAQDYHWVRYSSCKPCLVRYDYISRTETVHLDSEYIMTMLESAEEFPVIHSNVQKERLHLPSSHLWQFENVTTDLLARICELYGADMDIFGYHYDSSSHTATCKIDRNNGSSCC